MKAALLIASALLAQDLGSLKAPPKTRQYVEYVSEALTIPAGKPAIIELHFRTTEGFHVNSHKPNSDLQIPTEVEFAAAPGVKASPAQYPPGKLYSFSFAPEEKLDVYQDDFIIKVPVVAAACQHELKGALKYQACDKAACYPPKSLPLDVLCTAK